MSVANIWELQENTAALCSKISQNVDRSLGKRYKRIRICVTGEVETLSSPIRRQNSGCEHPGGMWAAAEFRMQWQQQDAMVAVGCNGGSRVQFLPGWNKNLVRVE